MGFLDGLSEGLDQPLDLNQAFDGPESTKSEVFGTAADATLKNDLSVSKEVFLQKATKERDDLFRKLENKTIYEFTGVKEFDLGQARGNTFEQKVPKDRDTQIDAVIRGLRNQDPGKYAGIKTSDEILEGVKNNARDSRFKAQETLAKAPSGIGSTAANFAGAGIASMADPINIASIGIGAGATAGILKTIAVSAVASGGSEALIQEDVEAWQKELGVEYGFKDKATAVGLATLFGGLIPAAAIGVGKAGSKAAGKFKKTSQTFSEAAEVAKAKGLTEESSALKAIARETELNESNPYRLVGEGLDDLDHEINIKSIEDSFKADEFPDFSKFKEVSPDEVLNNLKKTEARSSGEAAVFKEIEAVAVAARRGDFDVAPPQASKIADIPESDKFIRAVETRTGNEIVDASTQARNRNFSPEGVAESTDELDLFLANASDDTLITKVEFNGKKVSAKTVKETFEKESKQLDALKMCALRR